MESDIDEIVEKTLDATPKQVADYMESIGQEMKSATEWQQNFFKRQDAMTTQKIMQFVLEEIAQSIGAIEGSRYGVSAIIRPEEFDLLSMYLHWNANLPSYKTARFDILTRDWDSEKAVPHIQYATKLAMNNLVQTKGVEPVPVYTVYCATPLPNEEQKMESTKRGTGRTQRMLERVADAVQQNEAQIFVIGHTRHFCMDCLRPRLEKILNGRGIGFKEIRGGLQAKDSEIRFSTPEDIDHYIRGFREPIVFWDHVALEQSRTDAKDKVDAGKKIDDWHRDFNKSFYGFDSTTPCPDCNGTGAIQLFTSKQECEACGGTGTV